MVPRGGDALCSVLILQTEGILFCPWSSEDTIPTPCTAYYILAMAFPLRLWLRLLSTRRTAVLSLPRRGLDSWAGNLRLLCVLPDSWSEVKVDCEPSWQPFQSNCYRLVGEKKSWQEAKKTCLRSGGDLVSIHTLSELEFVTKEIKQGKRSFLCQQPHSCLMGSMEKSLDVLEAAELTLCLCREWRSQAGSRLGCAGKEWLKTSSSLDLSLQSWTCAPILQAPL